jgi:2-dehydropantoate 2-reductase
MEDPTSRSSGRQDLPDACCSSRLPPTTPDVDTSVRGLPRQSYVVGPGAVGSVIAACLHAAGTQVKLCGRTPRTHLEVRADDGMTVRVPGPVMTDPGVVDGRASTLFLAVKTTQVDAARGWLEALCDEQTVVCVLHNGIEHEQDVAPLAGSATVLPASVWFSAETHPSGWTRLRGRPLLVVPRTPAADVLAQTLRHADCDLEITDDFVSVAWRKLLANSLGGLMALTGRRAGVFARGDLADLARAYAQESLDVARAEGAHLPDSLPHDLVSQLRASPDAGTSILADRNAGRALEWNARNGVIARRARTHGIATPIGDVVVTLLAATSDGPG